MTLYLHKVTVRFHKVIVRFHKVTVSTNYEIELKNHYLMLDNFIICYSIKIFITLQYYIKNIIETNAANICAAMHLLTDAKKLNILALY